ncbi:hypothetical protein BJ508DRAFT_333120 [Ascobolus immersus RN42]|uniref:Uncharacterized protein n=1 Tax=Ascobolus immersus RN42 TaxID=1160509 RepID=A0A3N4HQS8_ASCIM|nr:hypothetical protein BJ508DRAFT_333120 [Ascobolus immersus RN42]
MPTTVDEVFALTDDQLGRVLRAAGACSHNPGNGAGLNRYEMLGMVFALTGSRPLNDLVWTTAPNFPHTTLPPRTAEQAGGTSSMPRKRQIPEDDDDETANDKTAKEEVKYQRKRYSITQARRPQIPSPPRLQTPSRRLFRANSSANLLSNRSSQSQANATTKGSHDGGPAASTTTPTEHGLNVPRSRPSRQIGFENPFIVPTLASASTTPRASAVNTPSGSYAATPNIPQSPNIQHDQPPLYTPSRPSARPQPFRLMPQLERQIRSQDNHIEQHMPEQGSDVNMPDIPEDQQEEDDYEPIEDPELPEEDGDFIDATFEQADFYTAGSEPRISSDFPFDEPISPTSSPPSTPRRPYKSPTVEAANEELQDVDMVDATETTSKTANPSSPNRSKGEQTTTHSPSPTQRSPQQTPGQQCARQPPDPPDPPPDVHPFASLMDDIGSEVTQTQAAAYTWKHKHQVSDQAYQELIDMATQQWFNVKDLPFSATTLKGLAKGIPMQRTSTKTVRIALSNSFSNTRKPWATMYRFSVKDTIQRMLCNNQIVDQAHFGPRVEPADRKATEVHHGSLVGGSVLACPSLYPLRTPPSSPDTKGDYIMPGNCYRMKIRDPFNNRASVNFDVRVTQVLIKETPQRTQKKATNSQNTTGGQKVDPPQAPQYTLGKKYNDDDLTVKVQPIITNRNQLRLFGLAKDDDRFDFDEVDEHGAKTAYIIKHEFDTQLGRLLSKATVRIDRSKHNLNDSLPDVLGGNGKKPRKKRTTPAKAKGSTGRKGRQRKATSPDGTDRVTRSRSKTPPPDIDSQNDNDSSGGSGTDSSAASNSDEEKGFDYYEGLLEPEEESEFPIVTDEVIDTSATHAVRYIITPENTSRWDHEMFFRPVRTRGVQGPEEVWHEGRQLRRQHERLARRYDTKLRVLFVKLIHAGHLRETLAELEFRKGEFNWDDLEDSKEGRKPPRIGVYVDFYVDKFGIFRTTHRSAGGLYTTLLNLNFRGRDQPRNHACQGFLPNGCEFHNGGREILMEYAELAKGTLMKIHDTDYIVHVKMLSMSCDMAEANAIAGIEPRRPICMTLGPAFDPFIQIPIDISHSEQKGIGMVAIKNMMDKLFSNHGKAEFTRVFIEHPLPTNISKIVNPAYHQKRLMMHQVTTLMACMPFLLRKMDLSKGVFQTSIFEQFQEKYPDRVGGWDSTAIMDFLIETHLATAKANSLVFKRELNMDKDYALLESSIFESRRLLMEFYRPLENTDAVFRRSRLGRQFLADKRGGTIRHLPNFHQAAHMRETAIRYGTLLNMSCSIGELVHKLFKQLVPHTNYLDIERSFMNYWALMDALRFIIDCFPGHNWYKHLKRLSGMVPSLMSGYFFGQIARFSEDGDWAQNRKGLASRMAFMKEDRFPELYFGAQISGPAAKDRKYPINLRGKNRNSLIITSLSNAYETYGFEKNEVLVTESFVTRDFEGNKNIYYPRLAWWASLTFFDTIRESRQRLRIGDVIAVDERTKRTDEFVEGYAKILGICTHNNKGTNYVFLYIEWLEKRDNKKRKTTQKPSQSQAKANKQPLRKHGLDDEFIDEDAEDEDEDEDEDEPVQHESVGMGELQIWDAVSIKDNIETKKRYTNFIALCSVSDGRTPYFIPIDKSLALSMPESVITNEDDPNKDQTESFYLNHWFFRSV